VRREFKSGWRNEFGALNQRAQDHRARDHWPRFFSSSHHGPVNSSWQCRREPERAPPDKAANMVRLATGTDGEAVSDSQRVPMHGYGRIDLDIHLRAWPLRAGTASRSGGGAKTRPAAGPYRFAA